MPGIVFNTVVRLCLRLPFVDTQCGFKAFKRERCKIIFEQQRIERFGFDPELLYLARPSWTAVRRNPRPLGPLSPGTKVSMLRDSLQMFADVFIIRWNAHRRTLPPANANNPVPVPHRKNGHPERSTPDAFRSTSRQRGTCFP